MSLSELTWSAAIDRLAVYTAMEDSQLAHNCEAVVRAEIERLRASLARTEPSEAVVGLYYAIKLCAARIERPNLSPDADVVLERARAAIAAYEAERLK